MTARSGICSRVRSCDRRPSTALRIPLSPAPALLSVCYAPACLLPATFRHIDVEVARGCVRGCVAGMRESTMGGEGEGRERAHSRAREGDGFPKAPEGSPMTHQSQVGWPPSTSPPPKKNPHVPSPLGEGKEWGWIRWASSMRDLCWIMVPMAAAALSD